MRIRCNVCGKPVSTEVPNHTVIRGWVECPECVESGEMPKVCDDGKKQNSHVEEVKVFICTNASCPGDEEGCNNSDCRKPRWRTVRHFGFVNLYGRCPRGCKKKKTKD